MEIETLCSSLDFGAAISKQAHEIELVNFQFDKYLLKLIRA